MTNSRKTRQTFARVEATETRRMFAGFAQVADGVLDIAGTNEADEISVTASAGQMTATINGEAQSFPESGILAVVINAFDGNDTISGSAIRDIIFAGPGNDSVTGNNGDDKILGDDGDDTLSGNANKDTIVAGLGIDRLNGHGGNDKLFGEAGPDRLFGREGNDYLDGGSSNDRLDGGDGADTMLGQGGDDRFYTEGTFPDDCFGGTGTDTAQADSTDNLNSIEILL